MGANIGTTVTSQLISLNLSALAPAIVMAGVVMVMFCNKTKIQRAGEVLLGFGISLWDFPACLILCQCFVNLPR